MSCKRKGLVQLTSTATVSTGILCRAGAVRPKQQFVANLPHWATASQRTGQTLWTAKQTQWMSPFEPSRYRKTGTSLCGPGIHDLVIWIAYKIIIWGLQFSWHHHHHHHHCVYFLVSLPPCLLHLCLLFTSLSGLLTSQRFNLPRDSSHMHICLFDINFRIILTKHLETGYSKFSPVPQNDFIYTLTLLQVACPVQHRITRLLNNHSHRHNTV